MRKIIKGLHPRKGKYRKYVHFVAFLLFLVLEVNPLNSNSTNDHFSTEVDYDLPKDYFRSPINIPLALAGNFAELRGNHFHSGIDIKTQGREGLPIFSTAEGYVSRIKIQAGGYGNAIYINHPKGYKSVYAHLKSYDEKFAEIVKAAQYKNQSFEVDLYFKEGELPVERGEQIALSGNSGSSTAPHLHFEIRNSRNEEPINPLLLGYDIKDTINPRINGLKISPIDEFSAINGEQRDFKFRLRENNDQYTLNFSQTIYAQGNVGFGLKTFDKLNDAYNRCGVFSIELFANGKKIYAHKLDRFQFRHTRYINSLVDYCEMVQSGLRYQKSYIDPGNKLDIYDKNLGDGVLSVTPGEKYSMQYIVRDVYGNTSTLDFDIVGTDSYQITSKSSNKVVKSFQVNEANDYRDSAFYVTFPSNAFYTPISFEYEMRKGLPGYYSDIHKVHNSCTPVQNYYNIWIKPKNYLKEKENKLCIVTTTKSYVGGYFDDGYVKGRARGFASYQVWIDTIPPTIRPLNIYENKSVRGVPYVKFQINDNLSGVSKYDAYIDGKWVLLEYDSKYRLLKHYFDKETLTRGKHELKIVLEDGKNNKTNYRVNFIY
ncbi:MAG: murein DD-endopeptidase MepM/ murein hydrolase activator NlpD [Sphingobacteriales bacterium]|jgi:murein DD-endopeptidase MepM/ murein hydrolase activator NlpD